MCQLPLKQPIFVFSVLGNSGREVAELEVLQVDIEGYGGGLAQLLRTRAKNAGNCITVCPLESVHGEVNGHGRHAKVHSEVHAKVHGKVHGCMVRYMGYVQM